VSRVVTIDWDVHHGNGTQQAFYEDPNVLTISLHQNGLYPPDSGHIADRGAGPGEGSNINIPLPAGSGRGAYEAAFERIIGPAVRNFGPDLILVPSGFDASVLDPLGRMMLTAEAYRGLTKTLMQIADDTCNGRLVLSHEGGYSKHYVPFCGIATVEALSGIRTEVSDTFVNWENLPGQDLESHQEAVIDEIAALVN
jgi:acetoin utilization deacetylase AcuC-like enzyme